MEKCTKCGGLLNFDPSSQKLLCKSCQSTYDILESNKFVLHPFDMSSKTTEDTIDENSIKSHCSSCGAVFSGKNLAISSVCSYCGAPLVLDYDAFGIDACIPFAFDRTTAKQKFKEGIKSKWFLPRKFKKEPPENEIESVYIPAYLCNVKTQNEYSGEIYNESRNSDGSTNRSYRKIKGNLGFLHENIVTECSSQITQTTLNEINPFDVNGAKKFSPDYLMGYSTEFYNRNLEQCKQNIKAVASSDIRERILKNYNYDGVNYLNIHTDFFDCTYSKIILPTYKVKYTYAGKEYSTFMNGQTGKVGGNLPRSIGKILLSIAGGLLLVGLIGFLIFYFFK